ncbi:MAG TPA: tRNA lysidine(34) synthetase TilS [Acidimicrobiales bacterium]|nr:tRNA lysidine(34) synthetase TilS [Acidimicrobiales bacterium]
MGDAPRGDATGPRGPGAAPAPADGYAALVDALLGRCEFPAPGEPVDCAVSGGPDSLALLVLATAAGCCVTAWHVDHGLRAGADAEAALVAAAAARYGAAFRRVAATVAPGPNLEDRARRARFDALPSGVCTGHTADDQAETVLLALLRGAGVDGLAGMAPAHHPLLGLRRSETAALCRAEGLATVDDPTNRDPAILRNRVRHELLPLANELAGRDLVPVLARTAAVLRGDAELLAAHAAAVDATDALALAAAPTPSARRAVRAWLAQYATYPPSVAAVDRVISVARGEAVACEVAGVGRIQRHAQRLSVQPKPNT